MSQSNTADREIIITRIFDAPTEQVFDAFTRPEHVDQWWRPNGFTTKTTRREVRPGACGSAFGVNIGFEPLGKKTRVTMHCLLQTVAEFERVKSFGAVDGGNQTLARLHDWLTHKS